jgi:hypothetical protein
MIWTDFLSQVRRELEESQESVYSDTSLLNWTNEAARDIATKTRVLSDEIYADSVAGQRSYDLDDYTLDVIGVYYDGDDLARESAEGWKYLGAGELTTEGAPHSYAWFGSPPALYLRPVPSVSAQMRVFRHRTPEPITTGADPMPFESRFDRIIADYVKARAFEQTGEWDASDRFSARYDTGMASAMADTALAESADAPSSVPVERY